jgi:hypothetical protein
MIILARHAAATQEEADAARKAFSRIIPLGRLAGFLALLALLVPLSQMRRAKPLE